MLRSFPYCYVCLSSVYAVYQLPVPCLPLVLNLSIPYTIMPASFLVVHRHNARLFFGVRPFVRLFYCSSVLPLFFSVSNYFLSSFCLYFLSKPLSPYFLSYPFSLPYIVSLFISGLPLRAVKNRVIYSFLPLLSSLFCPLTPCHTSIFTVHPSLSLPTIIVLSIH